MADRKPNQRSSIYQGQDGWWHGWVTLGIKDDGSPDRRHRMGKTEADVTRKVRDLERTRDTGHLAGPGKGLTVARWQLQRQRWRHGCADPHACGKDRHRDNCSPGCTDHARACPKRTGGGLRLTELKSDKSSRTIALPAALVAALKRTGPSSSRSV